MKNIIVNDFKHNKKTIIALTGSICLSFVLIFLISFIFSSVHNYMVKEVEKEVGNYHVKLKTNLVGLEDFSDLKKIKWGNDYIFITYHDINKVYKLTGEICKKIQCEDISYNDTYLSLYGVSKNKNLLKTFKNIIILLSIVISISTFFIIYTVYKIFLLNKYKQIGILKSIGMSNKQIIKLFVFEGLIISFISIVLSLVLSLLLMVFIIMIINNLLDGFFKIYLDTKFILYSITFILLLVIIISLIPVFKIKKTPVDLFNIVYKNKKTKYKFNNYIFSLAHLNYKRNKKNYRTIIISLFIFTVLYFTFSLFSNYALKIFDKYVVIPNYDIEISINETGSSAYNLLKNFSEKNNGKYKIYKTCQRKVTINENNYLDNISKDVNLYLLEGNNYFINKSVDVVTEKGKIIRKETKNYKNAISINIDNKNLLLKQTDKIPYGLFNLVNKNNLIVFTKDIDTFCSPNLTLFIKSSKNYEKDLNKLLNSGFDLYYVDIKKGKKIINNIILVINFFMYCILFLTFIIGLIAIISTLFLSMEYRKNELGVLFMLGFDKKQFNELIIFENLLIILKYFILSLPGIVFINLIINNIINMIVDVEVIFSYKSFIFCLLISIILVRLVMFICYKKYKKLSILSMISSKIV